MLEEGSSFCLEVWSSLGGNRRETQRISDHNLSEKSKPSFWGYRIQETPAHIPELHHPREALSPGPPPT